MRVATTNIYTGVHNSSTEISKTGKKPKAWSSVQSYEEGNETPVVAFKSSAFWMKNVDQ